MPDPRAPAPTNVAPQVTDAVSQANVAVLGSAPAVALGALYQATMHSLTLSMQNAAFAHQQFNITGQAATVQGVLAVLQLSGACSGPRASAQMQAKEPSDDRSE